MGKAIKLNMARRTPTGIRSATAVQGINFSQQKAPHLVPCWLVNRGTTFH